jgi:RsiW-degrading membrane proteinase PrsW (M82 family)
VIAACLSAIANDLLHVWLTARLGEQQARNLTPVLGGPLIEEASKALALLALLAYLRGGFSTVIDGILHGACVGIGFAMTENVGYYTLAALQGGTAGFVRSVYLRGLIEGLNHATFTGAVGAGLGCARVATSARGRVVAPLVGFAAAVLQHVVWNFVASRAVMDALCDPQVPGGACRSTPEPFALFATVPLIVALAIGPGVIALLVITARTSGPMNSGP